MTFTSPAARPNAPERPFGAVDLLTLVLEAIRPSLGFDLAVAVLCEDGRHVVPEYAAGTLTPSVVEGVHVQALAAFVELAGIDHATWPSEDPIVILLDGAPDRVIDEPESYEDAPLVVGGAVTGMLRISCAAPLTKDQRGRYFGMAADLSKAIERLDAQRTQTKLAQERLLQSEKMSSVGQLVSGVAHELNNPLTGIMGFAQLLLLKDLGGGRAPPGRDHLRRGRARLEDRVEPADLRAPAAGAEGLVEPQHAHRARARAAQLRPARA